MSTKYKRGNYSILKLGDETTPNIKGESAFFCVCIYIYISIYIYIYIYILVKLCVFNFKQCVKKPKKIFRKIMNFGSTNWLKKKRSRIQ